MHSCNDALFLTLYFFFDVQVRPPDDTVYLRFATKNPKKTRWVFHGEWCI